jgi:transposase
MSIAKPEIRKIAVEAYLSGKASQQQLADILGFHKTTIVRWIREYKRDGKLKPQTRGHMPRAFSEEERVRLVAMIEDKPDLTLAEIKEAFSKNCSLIAVHRELKRLGFRYKKTLKASEQERKDIAESRKKWAEFQKNVSAERLVFLDESSAKTNMTRLRGRSRGGSRCYAHAPCGHWKSLTMLSSIRLDGSTECIVVDGAMNKAMFSEYIAKILCPALRPNDIVIMDNLSAHKNPAVARHIKESGAEVLYLPPYSPDLNPIENMWSKIKQLRRGMEARAYDTLEKGIASALDRVSASDAQGWFKNCGYELFQV